MLQLDQSGIADQVGIFFTNYDRQLILDKCHYKMIDIVKHDTILNKEGDVHHGRCPQCGHIRYRKREKGAAKFTTPPCLTVTKTTIHCYQCSLEANHPIDYLMQRGKSLTEALVYAGVVLQLIEPPYGHKLFQFGVRKEFQQRRWEPRENRVVRFTEIK